MHWTDHKALDPTLTALKWLLSLCLAYQAAVFTWLLLDAPVIVLPEANRSAVNAPQTSKYFDIAQYHLFGQADQVTEIQTEISAPETRLRLSLLGVFMAEPAINSSAIIAEQGRDGEFFKVGDRVQGRAKLSQVYEDKVILDNSGKLETLTFEDATPSNTGIVSQAAKPFDSRNNRSKPNKDFNKTIRNIRTPEQFVDMAKEQLEDPQQALDNLGLKATGDGYELTPSANMLMGLGMKPGDKIISVNGNQLGDPEQDKILIDEVYASGNAVIVIERGSQRLTINHTF